MKTNFVFVIDENKKPLDLCHPAVARKLLRNQKAGVFRRYPFTIIVFKPVEASTQPIELKLDPGSKTTGIALVSNNQVIWGAELTHRGQQIRSDLDSRRTMRRSRRNRKTRYRQARFLNRTKPKGWLAPSLEHRVLTTMTWVKRLMKFCPITSIVQELVKFDTQALQNPEISGDQYQQGELFGYEIREYLLEKWQRKCAYCNIENVPLQIEHIVAKSRGGSDRVSNLCIACEKCNQKKGSKDIEEFLKGFPDLLKKIKVQAKQPLKDAAAVNSTRWKLFANLKELGIPISTSTGGRTKYNRIKLNVPKSHWGDASCAGNVEAVRSLSCSAVLGFPQVVSEAPLEEAQLPWFPPRATAVESLLFKTEQPLLIKACGYGSRQMTNVNKYGFPCSKAKQKPYGGWKTGDIVKLITKKGEVYVHRLLATSNPSSFEIRINGKRVSANPKTNSLRKVHARDGYVYAF